ncbi:hypothetical protein METBIDRAFT_13056 [Metschnikowia bicuspidata var. bicuspidata NRRL YB-4993]|uniref:Uncharacterized protein n=1 Tax=Metschnikowia bicuspidata var. bicuspidata NRRL YB-4993 TaxID=869754 RepID=A0A1A0H7M9_9ASCO|nr:hypothetical protein METBIDRAFT_13056 [Metschnikowia bicuspidata var. bicuspidata NRRL YB-4993]OBA20031.1 hypothetical protein METBIDRAFT_13056 [Metschnikowia bicuspidata var. bicuspidata NRRL YB-4993]
MPLFLAASLKTALMLGATIGLVAALISNDKITEKAAQAFQKGADRLNDRLKHRRKMIGNEIVMAEDYDIHPEQGIVSDVATPNITDDEREEYHSHTDQDISSEVTTPNISDEENERENEDAELWLDDTIGSSVMSSGFRKNSEDH